MTKSWMTAYVLASGLLAFEAGAGIGSSALRDPEVPRVSSEIAVAVPSVRTVAGETCGPVQRTPAVAVVGTDYLVGWIENLPNPTLFVGRLTTGRSIRTGRGVQVAPSVNAQSDPVIVAGSNNFLVLWREENEGRYQILGRLFTRDADPVGPVLQISRPTSNSGNAGAAWNGQSFFISWMERVGELSALVGLRLAPDGSRLDGFQNFYLNTTVSQPTDTAVVWTGAYHFVVWPDAAANCTGTGCVPREIHAARIGPSGDLHAEGRITINVSAVALQYEPDVAWDGVRHLVIWTREEGGRSEVWGRLVNADGMPLEEPGAPNGKRIVAQRGGGVERARVTTDRTAFLVVFDLLDFDDRSIRGTRVARDGLLMDEGTGPFPIANSTVHETAPAVVTRPDGGSLVVYARGVPDACLTSTQIYGREIGPAGPDDQEPPVDPEPQRRRPARRR